MDLEFKGKGGVINLYETGFDNNRFFLGIKEDDGQWNEITGTKEELIKYFEDSIKALKQYKYEENN